jgi:hypothetical protein
MREVMNIGGLSQESVTLSRAKGLTLDENQMLRFAQHDNLTFLDSPLNSQVFPVKLTAFR